MRGLHRSTIASRDGGDVCLASPLWFLFLLAGMMLALHANTVPPSLFPDGWALFPIQPQIDARRAMMLFGLCMLSFYLPKLLELICVPRNAGIAQAALRLARRLRSRTCCRC